MTESDEGAERAQISLKVSPDLKDEWQEEAKENPEYSSLTHLIKKAVDREINGENKRQEPNGAGGKELDRLNEKLGNFREDMTELRSEIREVKGEMRNIVPDTNVRTEVFAELPAVDVQGPTTPAEPGQELIDRGVTVDDLQDRLPQYEKSTIRSVLRDLAEDTGQVGIVWVPENGANHYFKER